MIRKAQNSPIRPAYQEQPDLKNVDAAKNEIAIETLESIEPKTAGKDQGTSLIMERNLQAGLQAQELQKQVGQSGVVTNNLDPEEMGQNQDNQTDLKSLKAKDSSKGVVAQYNPKEESVDKSVPWQKSTPSSE